MSIMRVWLAAGLSALVSAISGAELMRASYLAASSTGFPIFFYGVVCLVYIALTGASETVIARLHRHLSRGRIDG